MKRASLVLLLGSVLVFGFAIAASAAPGSAAWIKVPFAFQAGNTLMPAGNYLFEMPRMGAGAKGSMLRITSHDGTICQYLFSQAIPGVVTDSDWHISFAKYGDTYFLAKVRNPGFGAEVTKIGLEKKLAAEFQRNQRAVTTVELQTVYSKAK